MKNILSKVKAKLHTTLITAKDKPFLIFAFVFGILAVVLLIMIISNILNKSGNAKNASSAPSSSTPSSEETVKILAKVKTHLVLPDEEPKVISLVNIDLLKKDQPFFALAKDGDKLLIYSKKVILYDPVIDRIVDIAQIRISPPSTAIQPSLKPSVIPPTSPPSPTPTVEVKKYKVSLYLTPDSADSEKKARGAINKLSQFEIAGTAKTKKSNYQNNIVVNLKGVKGDAATSLAEVLSATVAELPKEESPPTLDRDFLVIIAK
jgi:hypothetical protein